MTTGVSLTAADLLQRPSWQGLANARHPNTWGRFAQEGRRRGTSLFRDRPSAIGRAGPALTASFMLVCAPTLPVGASVRLSPGNLLLAPASAAPAAREGSPPLTP